MHFSILSFVVLTAAVAAQPSRRAVEFNPPVSVVQYVDWAALPPASIVPATNAKRFAQGLPPKNPTKRRPHRGGPHHDGSYHHGGTRVASAPRSQTSSLPPVEQKCNILAKNVDGTARGYINPRWNIYGEYGALQPSQDGALEVSFLYSPESPNQLTFSATNGPSAAYPLFGGIVGFGSTDDNLGPGSFNYVYLGGTTETSPGSRPVQAPNSYTAATSIPSDIASAIWVFDPATMIITPQWINEDESAPATYIITTQDIFALTGDPDAFASVLGHADRLDFICVPPTNTPARL